jgi:hypothetical protein
MSDSIYTTGVGSLPFDTMGEAISHSLNNYSIPWLPEIKNTCPDSVPPFFWRACSIELKDAILRDDVEGLKSILKGPIKNHLTLENEIIHGLYEFKTETLKLNPQQIKIQIIGPTTFSKILQSNWSIHRKLAVDYSNKWITQLSEKIAHELKRDQIILVWDEPMLDNLDNFQTFYRRNFTAIQCYGLHCCASFQSEFIPPEGKNSYISFDTSVTDLGNEPFVKKLQDFLKSGGIIALGVIDTNTETFNFDSHGQFKDIVQNLRRYGQIIVTPGCGTGQKTIGFENKTANALEEFALSL